MRSTVRNRDGMALAFEVEIGAPNRNTYFVARVGRLPPVLFQNSGISTLCCISLRKHASTIMDKRHPIPVVIRAMRSDWRGTCLPCGEDSANSRSQESGPEKKMSSSTSPHFFPNRGQSLKLKLHLSAVDFVEGSDSLTLTTSSVFMTCTLNASKDGKRALGSPALDIPTIRRWSKSTPRRFGIPPTLRLHATIPNRSSPITVICCVSPVPIVWWPAGRWCVAKLLYGIPWMSRSKLPSWQMRPAWFSPTAILNVYLICSYGQFSMLNCQAT